MCIDQWQRTTWLNILYSHRVRTHVDGNNKGPTAYKIDRIRIIITITRNNITMTIQARQKTKKINRITEACFKTCTMIITTTTTAMMYDIIIPYPNLTARLTRRRFFRLPLYYTPYCPESHAAADLSSTRPSHVRNNNLHVSHSYRQ